MADPSMAREIAQQAAEHTSVNSGAKLATIGGATSVLGLAVNEWMSIVGGLCAIAGVAIAYRNYRLNQKVAEARLRAIERGDF